MVVGVVVLLEIPFATTQSIGLLGPEIFKETVSPEKKFNDKERMGRKYKKEVTRPKMSKDLITKKQLYQRRPQTEQCSKMRSPNNMASSIS